MAEKSFLIVDTTLRDGEQRSGFAFSARQKAACAKIMDKMGIFQIEAGIPAIGRSEKDAVIAVKENCSHSLVSVWCRMTEADIIDAFDCDPDIIHIGVPVSEIQIKSKLRKDYAYVEEKMKRCAALALQHGYEVTLGFEDASRANSDFVLRLALTAKEIGIKRIRYADTVGTAMPHKVAEDTAKLAAAGIEVEIHAHDDLGLAVANTIEAVKHGAFYADTTFFGIGERAGNCSLRKLLTASRDVFNTGVAADKGGIIRAELEISEALGLRYDGMSILN